MAGRTGFCTRGHKSLSTDTDLKTLMCLRCSLFCFWNRIRYRIARRPADFRSLSVRDSRCACVCLCVCVCAFACACACEGACLPAFVQACCQSACVHKHGTISMTKFRCICNFHFRKRTTLGMQDIESAMNCKNELMNKSSTGGPIEAVREFLSVHFQGSRTPVLSLVDHSSHTHTRHAHELRRTRAREHKHAS